MPRILVLSASRVISGDRLVRLPGLGEVGPQDVTVATSSGTLDYNDISGRNFDAAVSLGPVGHHGLGFLSILSSALGPNAKLVIAEEGAANGKIETLLKHILLSGFVNAQTSPDGGYCTAERPSWHTGTKAAINLKPKAGTAATWSLTAGDEDDGDLLHEEDLLRAEDLVRPVPPSTDDCEIGGAGRKACANCTCGRAEGEEEPQKLTKEMLENPTSGCGSCGLGDAFRCAGCPYRGLPVFEMGKKIELPADYLLADLE